MGNNLEQRWDFAGAGNGEPGRNSELAPAPSLPQSGERMDPSVMNFIMQSTATAQIVRLRQLAEAQIPKGEIQIDITITGLVHIRRLTDPMISFTFVNDGPDSVFLEINKTGRVNTTRSPLLVNEVYTYNAGYPIIETLSFKVVDGESARIRLRGKTGTRQDFLTSTPVLAGTPD